MALRAGDEHGQHYEEMRRRVLRLHAAAVALDREHPGPEPDHDPGGVSGDDDGGDVGGDVGGDGSARTAGLAVTREVLSFASVPDGAGPPGAGMVDVEGIIAAGEPADVDERLVSAVGELTAATDELLAFGDRLPVLQDLPARASSVQVIRASALAVLLGAVLLGLGIWRGALAVWWLPVPLAMLPVAVRAALLGVAPAAGRHRRQRYAAATAGAAALLVAPLAAVSGWLPGLACVLALGVATSVLLDLRWERS